MEWGAACMEQGCRIQGTRSGVHRAGMWGARSGVQEAWSRMQGAGCMEQGRGVQDAGSAEWGAQSGDAGCRDQRSGVQGLGTGVQEAGARGSPGVQPLGSGSGQAVPRGRRGHGGRRGGQGERSGAARRGAERPRPQPARPRSAEEVMCGPEKSGGPSPGRDVRARPPRPLVPAPRHPAGAPALPCPAPRRGELLLRFPLPWCGARPCPGAAGPPPPRRTAARVAPRARPGPARQSGTCRLLGWRPGHTHSERPLRPASQPQPQAPRAGQLIDCLACSFKAPNSKPQQQAGIGVTGLGPQIDRSAESRYPCASQERSSSPGRNLPLGPEKGARARAGGLSPGPGTLWGAARSFEGCHRTQRHK